MPGLGEIQIASGAGTTTLQAQVAPTATGIFTLNSQGTGAGAIEHSISYELVTETNPAGADEIISIYSTGPGRGVSGRGFGSGGTSSTATNHRAGRSNDRRCSGNRHVGWSSARFRRRLPGERAGSRGRPRGKSDARDLFRWGEQQRGHDCDSVGRKSAPHGTGGKKLPALPREDISCWPVSRPDRPGFWGWDLQRPADCGRRCNPG